MAVAGIAAAQAAQAYHHMLMEEEHMTQYASDDLNNQWEFKIVRSINAVFRKPDVLRQLIDEEARAGWTMLEKFDDRRVRFKRPLIARTQDTQLLQQGIDPYRTQYGMSQATYTALILGVTFGIMFAIFGCMFVFVTMSSSLAFH